MLWLVVMMTKHGLDIHRSGSAGIHTLKPLHPSTNLALPLSRLENHCV